jgi:hypothetical protein
VIASALISCSSLLGPRPVQTLRGSTSGSIWSSARHENHTRVKGALPQSLGGWVRMFRYNIAGLILHLLATRAEMDHLTSKLSTLETFSWVVRRLPVVALVQEEGPHVAELLGKSLDKNRAGHVLRL